MAEGAGAGFDAGDDRLRMPAEEGIEMAEAVEFLEREEAAIGEDGVERQAAVPLAQDETVSIAPTGFDGPVPQKVVVEDTDDLHQGKSGADMTPPAILDGPKNKAPKMPAALIQRFKLDRIEVGVVVQQRRILHADSYTISVGVGQHFWLARKHPLQGIGASRCDRAQCFIQVGSDRARSASSYADGRFGGHRGWGDRPTW